MASQSDRAQTAPASIRQPDAFAAAFGSDALDLMIEMARKGDDLADAVVADLAHAPPRDRDMLADGISNGLGSLDAPRKPLRDLLIQAESLPAGVDQASLARGSEAYLSIGPLWLTIVLGPGSIAHTYSAPTIASVLMNTKNLAARTGRRLAETGTWNHQVARPGGQKPGAPGYVHSLQVRMLHARVRAGLLKQGWNVDEKGAPISQLDLARTWLDFTYIPFTALQKIGIDFASEELADLYAMWRVIAHQLGISEKLYGDVVDQASAAALLEKIDAVTGEPTKESAELVSAMLQAIAPQLAPQLGFPVDVTQDLLTSICRTFQGDDMADKLGLQPNWTASLIPLIADANRFRRAALRANPDQRGHLIAQTMAAFDQMDGRLEGPTTYQASITEPAAAELPQTTA